MILEIYLEFHHPNKIEVLALMGNNTIEIYSRNCFLFQIYHDVIIIFGQQKTLQAGADRPWFYDHTGLREPSRDYF